MMRLDAIVRSIDDDKAHHLRVISFEQAIEVQSTNKDRVFDGLKGCNK